MGKLQMLLEIAFHEYKKDKVGKKYGPSLCHSLSRFLGCLESFPAMVLYSFFAASELIT